MKLQGDVSRSLGSRRLVVPAQSRPNKSTISTRANATRNGDRQSDSISKSTLQAAALPLLAAVAFATPLSASAIGDAPLSPTVPLKREIVEEMLLSRFKSRVAGMTDSELAALTERLLAESAPFPTDLLLPPPPAAPRQRQPEPQPPLNARIEEKEEELDDTAALLRALGEVAGEAAAGAAADAAGSAVLDKLPPLPDIASWEALAPKVGRAVGLGAAAAAAVPVLAALAQRRRDQPEAEASEQQAEAPKAGVRWLGWLFKGEEEAPAVPDPGSPVEQAAPAQATPPPPPVAASASQPSGQVLWRRKEEESGAAVAGAPAGDNGQVLWRRKEGGAEAAAGGAQREQDLWRVPIESLRGGEEAAPAAVPVPPRAGPPSGVRSAPRVPRVSEAALDNAEPPDFAANGSR